MLFEVAVAVPVVICDGKRAIAPHDMTIFASRFDSDALVAVWGIYDGFEAVFWQAIKPVASVHVARASEP